MGRVTRKQRLIAELTAPEASPQEARATAARDATMARLAAARVCAVALLDSIDEATALFVDPDEDEKGKERTELVESALEQAGMATRALEAAAEDLKEIDPEECEPWDEDSEED